MIVFPNCKINLGLHILEKRDDGFHNLETVFYPVALRDALEITPNLTNEVEFTASGLPVNGSPADNLCLKAYHLLKKDFDHLPAIKIHLHKTIPMGAGLGGGSADAAFMLSLLDRKFKLNLTSDQLINYARQLGSDCPFFIINKPCYATGRGEIMEEITLDLSRYSIVLINPGIHVNTGWAFSNITPAIPKKSIKLIIQQPVETWKTELINDFENVVSDIHPEIKWIKEELYRSGAVYAAMSGSGSTVFGMLDAPLNSKPFADKNYFVKTII